MFKGSGFAKLKGFGVGFILVFRVWGLSVHELRV